MIITKNNKKYRVVREAENALMSPSLQTLQKLASVYNCEFVIRGEK